MTKRKKEKKDKGKIGIFIGRKYPCLSLVISPLPKQETVVRRRISTLMSFSCESKKLSCTANPW